jgi:hypothetical protein
VKVGVNDGLKTVLFEWFQQKGANNILIYEPILRAKATEVAAKMVISGFKASNGWSHL